MKILFTTLFLLITVVATAQPYDKDFAAIKKNMEDGGFTYMKMLSSEDMQQGGMIEDHMKCLPNKEVCFVGIQIHSPVDLHATVTIGVPGSKVRDVFCTPERMTSRIHEIYASVAGVVTASENPACVMDLYFYDAEYKSEPAYVLVFEKPVK